MKTEKVYSFAKQVEILALVFIFSFFIFHFSFGQTRPAVWLTWRAKTYAPAGYAGRAYVAPNAEVTASAALIQSGKILDLRQYTVKWFLNGESLQNGAGLDEITFKTPSAANGVLNLTAQISDANGVFAGKTAQLAVMSPELVIWSPYPDGEWGGGAVKLTALPFFFNTLDPKDFGIRWRVNGEPVKPGSDPENLSVAINPEPPSGAVLDVFAEATLLTDEETATRSLKLTHQ